MIVQTAESLREPDLIPDPGLDPGVTPSLEQAGPPAHSLDLTNAWKAVQPVNGRSVVTPTALAPSRWPGLGEAFAQCTKAARILACLYPTGLELPDIEGLRELDKTILARIDTGPALRISSAARNFEEFLYRHPYLKQWNGDINLDSVHPEDSEEFFALLNRWPVLGSELRAALGIPESLPDNPTVKLKTWMVVWTVTQGRADDLPLIGQDAALIVVPDGRILEPNLLLQVRSAWDLGNPESDVFCLRVPGDVLLLSEAQRQAWGAGMHLKGRVFWVVEPPTTKKGSAKVKTQKI